MVPKIISLSNFPKKPLHISGNVFLEPDAFQRGYVSSIKSIFLDLTIIKSENLFFLRGKIEEELELFCSRCLEPYLYHESIEIFHRLQEDEDLEVDEFQIINETFRPYDMVKELIDLNLPMKPLCSENCKGLCPLCGENLNFGPCNCKKII